MTGKGNSLSPIVRSAEQFFWILFSIILIALLPVTAFSKSAAASYAPFPAPDAGYITDNANLLSKDEQEQLEHWLLRTERQTQVEIIVVTVQSLSDYPGTPNESIESFAKGLFNCWKIGNLPKNDGVLLLICANDRKARIQLGDYYAHSRDSAAAKIMDEVLVPNFKRGEYAKGIDAGTRALMLEFAGVRVGWNWPLILGVAGIPVLAILAWSLFKNGKRGWGWIVLGLLIVVVLAVITTVTRILRAFTSEGDSDSWSSGGDGGFGGGSSGSDGGSGGGATGSW